MPGALHGITDLDASELADEHPRYLDTDLGTCKSTFFSRTGGAWDPHCTAGGPSSCTAVRVVDEVEVGEDDSEATARSRRAMERCTRGAGFVGCVALR